MLQKPCRWTATKGAASGADSAPAGDTVSAVAFAPDNKRLAICGPDSVAIWNVDPLEEKLELRVAARAVVFSPDGRRLATTGAESRCHYLSKASQFFIWAVANKRCPENPVAVVKRPKVVTDEIEFYTIDQCRRILELAPQYDPYHYIVLGLFPGIRPTELRRLDGQFVRLDRRIVILNAAATKKNRRRFIEMPLGDAFGDCLFDWLIAKPLVGPTFVGSHSTFVRRFREFGDALGFPWIQDGLRHTAATYHFAKYTDAAKTAALLGERDIRTLDQHYKGLATKAEAEAFYALRPPIATAIPRQLGSTCESPTESL